jgi:hypothetical protein
MTDVRNYQLGSYALGINETTTVRCQQAGAYALGIRPAEQTHNLQLGAYALVNRETSSGFHYILAHQLGAYALCRQSPRRYLRAWTFTQDEHDFYVVNFSEDLTLVYDKLTMPIGVVSTVASGKVLTSLVTLSLVSSGGLTPKVVWTTGRLQSRPKSLEC